MHLRPTITTNIKINSPVISAEGRMRMNFPPGCGPLGMIKTMNGGKVPRLHEVSLGNGNSTVQIKSAKPLAFSASHLHSEDLTEAKHTIDLQPRKETLLSLDAAHRGLGTASCRPDTYPQYKVNENRFSLDLEWCL